MATPESQESNRIRMAYEEGRTPPVNAPSYSPRLDEEAYLDRLGRQLRYRIVGAVIGLCLGLGLGAITISHSDLPLSNKIAFVLSMGVAGMLGGIVSGAAIESATASKY